MQLYLQENKMKKKQKQEQKKQIKTLYEKWEIVRIQ